MWPAASYRSFEEWRHAWFRASAALVDVPKQTGSDAARELRRAQFCRHALRPESLGNAANVTIIAPGSLYVIESMTRSAHRQDAQAWSYAQTSWRSRHTTHSIQRRARRATRSSDPGRSQQHLDAAAAQIDSRVDLLTHSMQKPLHRNARCWWLVLYWRLSTSTRHARRRPTSQQVLILYDTHADLAARRRRRSRIPPFLAVVQRRKSITTQSSWIRTSSDTVITAGVQSFLVSKYRKTIRSAHRDGRQRAGTRQSRPICILPPVVFASGFVPAPHNSTGVLTRLNLTGSISLALAQRAPEHVRRQRFR